MYYIAEIITEYLYFNMSCIDNNLFHVYFIITEGKTCFKLCTFIGILKFFL